MSRKQYDTIGIIELKATETPQASKSAIKLRKANLEFAETLLAMNSVGSTT